MKRVLSFVISLAMILGIVVTVPMVTVSAVDYDNRIETLFNNDWEFYRETTAGESETKTVDAIDAIVGDNWRDISLPHDFSIESPFSTFNTTNRSGCLPGGTGWYRKTFRLPTELEDKQFVINFDGSYNFTTVYVNGTKIGTNKMGYVSFAFDITEYLNFGFNTKNEIYVKVANVIPSERWYSGSGIYRDVTLIITEDVHVDYCGTSVVYPNLASSSGVDATTNVSVSVKNDGAADATASVVSTVLDSNGVQKATAESAAQTVTAGGRTEFSVAPSFNNPALWSVDSPTLYTLKTDVKVNGVVVDTYEEKIGYKYLEFDNESGFFINGVSMKLKGAALHNDLGASLGAATHDNAIKRYIDKLKDMGCNAIRTAHQPLSKNLMNYCAEIGMMVYDETYDDWCHAKCSDSNSYTGFFGTGIEESNPLLLKELMGNTDVSEWSTATTPTWAEFGIKSIMMRDRNNASVIIWGIGNELFTANYVNNATARAKYPYIAADLASWVHETDPQSRPATFGDNRTEPENTTNLDKCQAEMDITGINYAVGSTWESLYKMFPERPAFNTEGTDQCSNRGEYDHINLIKNGADDYRFTAYNNDLRDWAYYLGEGWNRILERDWFMGEFIWAGIDYLGEPCDYNLKTGLRTPNTTFCGAFDSAGFAKDAMYFYRSIWNEDSYTSNLLPGTWNSDEVYKDANGYVPVMVYSNADKVEVYLNGSKVATAIATVTDTSSSNRTAYTRRYWDVTVDDSSVCNSKKLVADTKASPDFTKLFIQMYVKYAEGTLEIKSYEKDGENYTLINDAAGTSKVSTTDGIADININQTYTTLVADRDQIVHYEIDAVDENGDFVNGYNGKVEFTLSGAGEIVGVDNGSSINTDRGCSKYVVSEDKTSAVTSCYNGKCLLAVRATDETGTISVSATAYDEENAESVVATANATDVTTTADIVLDEFEEEIEQHVHEYNNSGAKVVTPPTCDEEGYTTYTCDVCSEVTVSDYVDATAHTEDANGNCTVCSKNAAQIANQEAADYVSETFEAGAYKYTSVAAEDIDKNKAYSMIGFLDSQIRLMTSETGKFAPNNYYDGVGLYSYNNGQRPVKNETGEHISSFEFGKNFSNFYFDYDAENSTLVISAVVDGMRKYLAVSDPNLAAGGILYANASWVDREEEATVLTASYNEKTHQFGGVYCTLTDGTNTKKVYLRVLSKWYGGNQVMMVFTSTTWNNSVFEVFEAEPTVPTHYSTLAKAILKAAETSESDASYATAQAANVQTALNLYKTGVNADKDACVAAANALVSSLHTCEYSTTGVVTKEATEDEYGEIQFSCIHDGCANVKTEIIAKLGTLRYVYVTVDGETVEHDYGSEYTVPELTDDSMIAYYDGNDNYYVAGDKITLTSDIELTSVSLAFEMLTGASMRLTSPSGIRFYSDVNTDLIDALRAKGAEITLGTLITLEENIPNDTQLTKEMGVSGVDYQDCVYSADYWYQNANGFKGVVGSIVEISDENATKNFVGRGYITIRFKGETKTIYADYASESIANNSRSIAYVANKVMINDYNDLSAEYVTIVKKYADMYTGEDNYKNSDPSGNDIF